MSYNGSTALVCPAGSNVQYSATSGGTYAALMNEINSITLPDNESESYDLTNFNSTFPNSEEGIGWAKLGTAEIDCNLNAADYIAIKALVSVKNFFKINLTAGGGSSTIVAVGSFAGAVAGISGTVPVKGVGKCKVKVKLLTIDTWAA